jgi:hypothetical protein
MNLGSTFHVCSELTAKWVDLKRNHSLFVTSKKEGTHCQDQEQHKEDLGDARRAGRDAPETKNGGDERDDDENDGAVQHGVLLVKPMGKRR